MSNEKLDKDVNPIFLLENMNKEKINDIFKKHGFTGEEYNDLKMNLNHYITGLNVYMIRQLKQEKKEENKNDGEEKTPIIT